MPLSTEAARCIFEFQTPGAASTAATTIDLDAGFTVDPQDLVDDLRAAYIGQLLALTTDEWSLVKTTLYVPDSGGSIPYVSTVGGPGPTGTPMSAAVSLLVTKQTTIGGRRGKGRMFLPPPPQTQVNADGTVASGFVTSSQTKLDAFYNSITGVDPSVQFVVHTRSSGGLPAGNTLVTGLKLETEVATQRRRQRR